MRGRVSTEPLDDDVKTDEPEVEAVEDELDLREASAFRRPQVDVGGDDRRDPCRRDLPGQVVFTEAREGGIAGIADHQHGGTA